MTGTHTYTNTHTFSFSLSFYLPPLSLVVQSAADVEYTDWVSAEGQDSLNECPGYDTQQSDGKVPVILELYEMWSIPSLPSLPGPFYPGVVAPDKVLSMGLLELNWIVWNRTVYMYKMDLVLNN